MQLPAATSHYTVRVRYGRYVAQRLTAQNLTELAEQTRAETMALRAAGRAVEDADDPVQDAIATRDAASDRLILAVQVARNALAGRGVQSTKEAPYTEIFPDGIGYYTEATTDVFRERLNELVTRIQRALPASDDVRKSALKEIKEGLAEHESAEKAFSKARADANIMGTKLQQAGEKWERQMERTYGLSLAEMGKAAAERLFPKLSASKPRKTEEAPEGGSGNGEGGGAVPTPTKAPRKTTKARRKRR